MARKADLVLAELKALAAVQKPREITVEMDIKSDKPAETCIERMREAYAIMKAAHAECYQALQVIRQRFSDCDQLELTDVLFAIRCTVEFAEDIEKECNKAREEISRVYCERWALDAVGRTSYTGQFGLGIPTYKQRVNPPNFKRDPENYHRVMEWLGVPKDLVDRGHELFQEDEYRTKVVEIDYLGWMDLMAKYKAANIPIPDFVTQYGTFQEAFVTLRKVKDLL